MCAKSSLKTQVVVVQLFVSATTGTQRGREGKESECVLPIAEIMGAFAAQHNQSFRAKAFRCKLGEKLRTNVLRISSGLSCGRENGDLNLFFVFTKNIEKKIK